MKVIIVEIASCPLLALVDFNVIHQLGPARLTAYAIAGIVLLVQLAVVLILMGTRRDLAVSLKERDTLATRLQALMKASGTGAWEYTPETDEFHCSPEYFTMLGYDPEADAVYLNSDTKKHWTILVHPEDQAPALQKFNAHLQNPQGMLESQFRMRRKNGDWTWILSRGKLICDHLEDGNCVVVGTNIDITEQKQLEEALFESKSVAEKATLSKTQFLANMSHELRTPLNGLSGMIQLLHFTDLTAEQQELVENCKTSTDRLTHIIGEIIAFTRLNQNSVELQNEVMAPRRIVEEVSDLYQFPAHEKGLSLQTQIEASVPEFILSDPFRTRQVLMNLIGNAVKFSKEGSVTVRLSAEESPAADEASREKLTLRYEIEDTGIGISEEQIKHIWDYFYQGEEPLTKRYPGIGIGLPIAKKIIDLMDGHLDFESTLHVGSRFYFTCPVKKVS